MTFDEKILEFISLCYTREVRMLLVGGGAVNFHGYQRHSADVDFWIDLNLVNLEKLREVLMEMGYGFESYPPEVLDGLQNISVKISPFVDIELITRFNPGKSFDDTYRDSNRAKLVGKENITYQVLSYEDLINSKIRSGRPKDMLDIQELQRIRNQVQDDSNT